MSTIAHPFSGEMRTGDGRIGLACEWVDNSPVLRLTLVHDRPHRAADVATLKLSVSQAVELMGGLDDALQHLLKTQPPAPSA